MKKESIISGLLLAAIVILFLFILKGDTRTEETKSKEIEELKKKEQVELRKIDSLQAKVRELDSVIIEGKKQTKEIDTVIIKERERIIRLPIDSAVNLLKQNIQEYESAKLHP